MVRRLAVLGAVGVAGASAPSVWCERGAAGWYAGDPAVVAPLVEVVAGIVSAPLAAQDFGTGNARFDGEWWFGTYQMAALGFAQIGELERASLAIDRAADPAVWAFDRDAWGDLALGQLADDPHDHAVLGYLGVALGLERALDTNNRHAALHDAVAAHLRRRLVARGDSPLETYPGEAYPVDNAAVLATLALHARATGQPPDPLVEAAVARWEAAWVAEDGLAMQTVGSNRVRGSGTALSAYFLGFTHPALSARLAAGIHRQLAANVLGFGAVREYRRGEDGAGDIDSGPLIGGWSISATGFSLAAARRQRDAAWFADLYGTACLVGQPGDAGFATGGPLGNAILFAMLTAPDYPVH
jgi:hypothetical protein